MAAYIDTIYHWPWRLWCNSETRLFVPDRRVERQPICRSFALLHQLEHLARILVKWIHLEPRRQQVKPDVHVRHSRPTLLLLYLLLNKVFSLISLGICLLEIIWKIPRTHTRTSSRKGKRERMRRTDPLSLFHLFTESEDPLVLVPLVPRSSGNPLLPVPLVPLVPTCANLCHLRHLVVPLEPLPTLFSQTFFWVSQCHSIFGQTVLTENFLQNTVDSIFIGMAK